jgi:hypothetical protein
MPATPFSPWEKVPQGDEGMLLLRAPPDHPHPSLRATFSTRVEKDWSCGEGSQVSENK